MPKAQTLLIGVFMKKIKQGQALFPTHDSFLDDEGEISWSMREHGTPCKCIYV